MKARKRFRLFLDAGALLAGWISALILIVGPMMVRPAFAQQAIRTDLPLQEIAPGSCTYSTTLSVISTGTRYIEHAGNGANGGGRADYLPIPDGTTVVGCPRDSGVTVKACVTANPDDTVGDQASADTANTIGGTDGTCFTFPGGTCTAWTFRFATWSIEAGGYFSSICTGASPHDVETPSSDDAWDVYAACEANADCQNTAGYDGTSGGTCSSAPNTVLSGGKKARGLYWATRSTATVITEFCLKR